jgi:hypothetical protein
MKGFSRVPRSCSIKTGPFPLYVPPRSLLSGFEDSGMSYRAISGQSADHRDLKQAIHSPALGAQRRGCLSDGHISDRLHPQLSEVARIGPVRSIKGRGRGCMKRRQRPAQSFNAALDCPESRGRRSTMIAVVPRFGVYKKHIAARSVLKSTRENTSGADAYPSQFKRMASGGATPEE